MNSIGQEDFMEDLNINWPWKWVGFNREEIMRKKKIWNLWKGQIRENLVVKKGKSLELCCFFPKGHKQKGFGIS